MKKNDYRFDHDTATLFITKSFKIAASKLGTPEYKIILELRRDNPEMKIELTDDPAKKNTTPKLSYTQMKHFIAKCRNTEERMKIFECVYALSQVQRSPYHYMKAWFLDNYANYSDKPEFDADGFVIVKTKAQLEAEIKAAQPSTPIADAQNEADAA